MLRAKRMSSGSDEVDTVKPNSGGLDVEIQNALDVSLTKAEINKMINISRNLKPKDYGAGTIEKHKITDVWSLYRYMKLRQHIIPEKFDFSFLLEVLEDATSETNVNEVLGIVEKYKEKSESPPKKQRFSDGSRSSMELSGDDRSTEYKTFSDGGTASTKLDDFYDFNGKQLVVIVNNFTESRSGTMEDEVNVKTFFNELERDHQVLSTIQLYTNLSKNEMARALRGTAQELKTGKYDRLMVFIMSHGKEDAVVGYHKKFDTEGKFHNVHRDCAECEQPLKVEEIYETFEKSLHRKPKLFFLVACNGHKPLEQADSISNMDDIWEDESDTPLNIPCPKRADMFIGCASVKGHISFRSRDIGTYYIDRLLTVFKTYMVNNHLVDMVTEAQRRVSERISNWVDKQTKKTGFVQMPYYQSSLRLPVYILRK